ncbi:MAG TPA: cytochrome b/b6 domain-containing protein [Bellilinea sp.]|nr:cytochrome b/b6 domain-containing protein [Bellilinea sp.]
MANKQKTYKRFGLERRIEHWILFVSFTLLAITGLAQKYSQAGISLAIISALGGIQVVRIIHRVSAVVFGLQSVYHVLYAFYLLYVKRKKATMVPGIQDLKDFVGALAYNFGIKKDAPKMGRYNFAEKMEYWAMVWGLVLMGLTGLMLWNPIATSQILPGQFIPAAKVAHGMEALLAVLAIILWHFYNVHIKFLNKSMFKGHLTRHQMEEEHALELEQIESGEAEVALESKEVAKRKRIFFPIATAIAVLFVAGLFYVITMEKTAITTTIPPESQQNVYVPLAPTPIPTVEAPAAQPTGSTQPGTGEATKPPAGDAKSWTTGIDQIFAAKCGTCHGQAGGVSVKTYEDLMKGANGTPVVVSGDAANSLVITVTAKGHPGSFTEDEVKLITDWINNGLAQ